MEIKNEINIIEIFFKLIGCQNKLAISKKGRKDLGDSESWCGQWGSLDEKSSHSTRMTLSFKTGLLTLGSRFHCEISAIVDSCDCGKRKNEKIVGGDETKVNEFPSMAGLVDDVEGIICGATISK